jgi:excisionase family DNA binding protein
MPNTHDILTASEVAAWLRLAVSTVYAWAAKGTIPSIRLNGCLRFDREELARWIEQARATSSRSSSASVCEQPLHVASPLSRTAMVDAGRHVIRTQRLAGRSRRGR